MDIFQDIAEDYKVDDQYENGRGTTLTDILYIEEIRYNYI